MGHAIAYTLAAQGLCGELRLTDFDDLELSNLNRVPASVFDLGVNKAAVCARRIAELDPYLPVTVMPAGITPQTVDEFVDGLDIVIEECDSLDAKVLIREVARSTTRAGAHGDQRPGSTGRGAVRHRTVPPDHARSARRRGYRPTRRI